MVTLVFFIAKSLKQPFTNSTTGSHIASLNYYGVK